ncbi:MAG: ribosomal protein S18-alanine N-acetyltransferase [Candidatus Saliniplasma sp.]
MKKIKIRKCKRKDIPMVLTIEKKSFEYPYSDRIFYSFLNSDKFLVAEHKKKVVGYIMAAVRRDEGVIISIAVHPDFRRQGIGKMLMKDVIALLDTDKVSLTLREYNISALRFYSKLGFKIKGMLKEYYENGDNAIIMKRDI